LPNHFNIIQHTTLSGLVYNMLLTYDKVSVGCFRRGGVVRFLNDCIQDLLLTVIIEEGYS
tara:strand:+ start:2124 stop:2303 length:180 start_codon:yes stop_codon:yes gene_type:complete